MQATGTRLTVIVSVDGRVSGHAGAHRFGYHPLCCFLDNAREALSGLMRAGRAGSNTTRRPHHRSGRGPATGPRRSPLRHRIVLACAEGASDQDIAVELGIWPQTDATHWSWASMVAESGLSDGGPDLEPARGAGRRAVRARRPGPRGSDHCRGRRGAVPGEPRLGPYPTRAPDRPVGDVRALPRPAGADRRPGDPTRTPVGFCPLCHQLVPT